MYRPRSGMAKMLYEKIKTDERLQSMDKSQWYKIDKNLMNSLSPEIESKFIQFEIDESTQSFLDTCVQNSDNTFWQLWLTLASSVLSWFLTNTSVNGLLGRGSMQVFSSKQFQRLIDHPQRPCFTEGVQTKLLDIGAGDGSTTDMMAPFFKDVYVTEMSTTMRWTLQKKGYHVLDVAEWSENNTKYDVVSCLNVLDRCEKPISLLNQIKEALKPDGVAVLSFVIPFNPYVEFGNDKNHEPSEKINISDKQFEREVAKFVETVLTPQGFQLIKWTRLPYLCEGDIQQAFYWLDDVIFVVQRQESNNTCPIPMQMQSAFSSNSCPNPPIDVLFDAAYYYVSDDR